YAAFARGPSSLLILSRGGALRRFQRRHIRVFGYGSFSTTGGWLWTGFVHVFQGLVPGLRPDHGVIQRPPNITPAAMETTRWQGNRRQPKSTRPLTART